MRSAIGGRHLRSCDCLTGDFGRHRWFQNHTLQTLHLRLRDKFRTESHQTSADLSKRWGLGRVYW
jgi:hypothetical protein